jgi:hypothetical protein
MNARQAIIGSSKTMLRKNALLLMTMVNVVVVVVDVGFLLQLS